MDQALSLGAAHKMNMGAFNSRGGGDLARDPRTPASTSTAAANAQKGAAEEAEATASPLFSSQSHRQMAPLSRKTGRARGIWTPP